MKISVVMSTYNAEPYLDVQLDSLLRQTRIPDEVIILDDGSTDDTVKKIENFIDKNQLSNWMVKKNVCNIGWQTNFINAIKKTTGDVVFTCDQDDIWLENKIESMTAVLEGKPQILLLAGDYKLLEEKTEGTFIEREIFTDSKVIEKKVFDEKFFYVQRPGCVFAFRRELWKKALNYTFPNNPHDALLWRTAITLDGLYLFHHPVILWRRHKKAETNGARPGRDKMLEWFDYVKNVTKSLERLLTENNVNDREKKVIFINHFERVIETRQKAYENKNPFIQIKTWKDYKYYPTNKSVLGETLRILKMKLK